MNFLNKFNDGLEKITKWVMIILMALLVVVVFVEVIFRNFIKKSILWSTELSMIAFIWLIFLGAARAVRHRRHYVVDLVPERFVKTNIIMDIGADIISYVLLFIMVFNGIDFTLKGITRYTTTLGLPQAIIYIVIPISGMIMTFFNTEQVLKNIKRFRDEHNGNSDKGAEIIESNSSING